MFRSSQIEGLSDSAVKHELRSVNALYSLLDDRYSKKVCNFSSKGRTIFPGLGFGNA
jgi:hypothetical protein